MGKLGLLPRGGGVTGKVERDWDGFIYRAQLVLRYTHKVEDDVEGKLRALTKKHAANLKAEIEECFEVPIIDVEMEGYWRINK